MKMRLRKIGLILMICIGSICLAGCWNYTEVNKQVTVAGLAIDKGEAGKKYHISVEIINVGRDGKSQIESTILEAEGDTVFETLRDMVTVSSKKLFFGHCKILIIGEDLAKEGLLEAIDFVFRDHETRISMNVLMSKGCRAKDILSTKGIMAPIVSYEINDLLETTQKSVGELADVHIYQLINDLETTGISSTVPALELVPVEDFMTFKFAGTGIFKQDKLVGYITPDESKILMLINNKIKHAVFRVKIDPPQNGYLAFEVYKNKTKIIPYCDNNQLHFEIKIDTCVNLGEVGLVRPNIEPEEAMRKMKEGLEKSLEDEVQQLVIKVQKELGRDIFGFGQKINQHDPKLWEQYVDIWDQAFKEVTVQVDCNVDIRSKGMNRRPIRLGD